MQNVRLEVAVPTGRFLTKIPLNPAPRLAGVSGKKIGLLWNGKKNGDLVLERIAQLLGDRFQDVQFVKLKSGADLPWGAYPHEETVAEIAKTAACDAVIGTMGD